MIELTYVAERGAAAQAASLTDLAGRGGVLVLAPHPDDEALAMGGAIAAAAQAGRAVTVAVGTDGGRSHPNSQTHRHQALTALRRAEVEAAVDILTAGSGTTIWLGYPDMAAPESDDEYRAVSRRLTPFILRATAIWTTWNGDPHPDHQRVWRLGRWLAAVHGIGRFFSCPLWGRVQTPAEDALPDGMRRFETGPFRRLKARAVAAHASQMTRLIADDPTGFRMSAELAEHFVATDEIFIAS